MGCRLHVRTSSALPPYHTLDECVDPVLYGNVRRPMLRNANRGCVGKVSANLRADASFLTDY